MLAKGIFISLEGIDGSGKSTLHQVIRQSLLTEYKVISVREPGGTFISEKIRELLLDIKNQGIAPETEAILYASARAQLIKEIIAPALGHDNIVIADRFMDSTIAYQGFGRGLDLKFLHELNDLCTGGLKPDLTLLLDITPEEAQKRKAKERPDRLEKEGIGFQKKVRQGYLRLAAEDAVRIKIITAREQEAVQKEALQYIKGLIAARWG